MVSLNNSANRNSQLVLIIVGPTAVGKSSIAVEVATILSGEVISLDSRQIYSYMGIGTAQPTKNEMQGIPHHLYGIRSPNLPVSAGEYAKLVEKKIDDIFLKGKLPIVIGGSGLYLRALKQGLFEGSTTDKNVRNRLKEELEVKGSTELLKRLQKIDPEYARIVHPHNHKRLIRALEIYEITGFPPTEHFRRQEVKKREYEYFIVYLKAHLDYLAKRIETRTTQMLQNGWIEEVQQLRSMGINRKDHSMDSIGYREIMNYSDEILDFEEMINLINLHSRQLAKKQMKWFNHESSDLILNVTKESTVKDLSNEIVKALSKSFDH
ncbi:MAG: tRNA (adenosine(37)-N6)-dimethylallyltransferase MiaA [Candidatus Marinimicrobia bacterium]|nr:tRNA (adenosine(37)-N6)-dimethylallyltransferase MiaA [Candidatus Neomarinimicrobiota bacterium]